MGMMHRMAMGPAVVRHQQNAVQHETHNTFNSAVGVEGVMSALMGDHPAAHRDGAGDYAVEEPKRSGCCRERNACSNANGQRRKANRHGQARPCFCRTQLGELRGQGSEQFSFGGIGDWFSGDFGGRICWSDRCCKCQTEASRQARKGSRLRFSL